MTTCIVCAIVHVLATSSTMLGLLALGAMEGLRRGTLGSDWHERVPRGADREPLSSNWLIVAQRPSAEEVDAAEPSGSMESRWLLLDHGAALSILIGSETAAKPVARNG